LIIFAFWAQRFRLKTDSNPAPVRSWQAGYPGFGDAIKDQISGSSENEKEL